MIDNGLPFDEFVKKSAEDGYILSRVAYALSKSKGKAAGLRESLSEKALAAIVRTKIEKHRLNPRDLERERFLLACEKYLIQKYPDLQLSSHPENVLLYGLYAGDIGSAIRTLVERSNLGEIDVDKLDDLDYMSKLEAKVAKLYPEIDLNEDPAMSLLEGEWAEELEKAIDDLVI